MLDGLQVGPGTGVLTRGLLEAGARVTAIEKVRHLSLLTCHC
jgi:16S rRNA A1518/A1519 N6-dimethyltransferase RsmA/KsgA/DIM1 with predicted DNA glycosylase/AP lyase activity